MITFGFVSTRLDELVHGLSPLLGVEFKPHESDFRGGEYYRAETPFGALVLQTNWDPFDKEPFERTWPEKQALLYFDLTDSAFAQQLASAVRSNAQLLSATEIAERP